jgi:hypothetical protein
VSAFGASGEEHVEAELGDVLKLALRGRVVDGHEWVVDESEERRAVILVVGNRRRQRLGREKRGFHGVEPALEILDDGTDVLLSMLPERVSAQSKLLCLLLLAVHGADERAAFCGEHGLGGLGVAEFAATVSVAPGFEYVA